MSPKMNFDKVEEAGDYSPPPGGKYPIKVYECEKKQSHAGNEVWNIKMEILEGEFEGKRIFDNIAWTEKAYSRVKLVLSRFGLPVKGDIDYESDELVDATALVETEIENVPVFDENGEPVLDEKGKQKTKPRNKVLFAGYEKWSPGESTPESVNTNTGNPDETEEATPF